MQDLVCVMCSLHSQTSSLRSENASLRLVEKGSTRAQGKGSCRAQGKGPTMDQGQKLRPTLHHPSTANQIFSYATSPTYNGLPSLPLSLTYSCLYSCHSLLLLPTPPTRPRVSWAGEVYPYIYISYTYIYVCAYRSFFACKIALTLNM